MNVTVIASEVELKASVYKYLPLIASPKLRLVKSAVGGIRDSDIIDAKLDNKCIRFSAKYKLNPNVRDVEALSSRQFPDNSLPLLIAVRLTDALVDHCRRQNVNCLDLNGRIWLRAKGMLIEKSEPGKNEKFVLAEAPVDIFSLKSSRLTRVLLTHTDRQWKQSDLVAQTELSQGLISRLLRYASSQGWVDGEGARGSWRVIEHQSLLDAWEKADRWEKRTVIKQYSTIESDFRKLARSLVSELIGEIAFTQWFAANLRIPYTETPVLSAYVRTWPDDKTLSRLGLRQVSGGGKVWLIVPSDPGVFIVNRDVQGLPIVADVQIYLDLIHAGLRGPDQARELRNWEGFCK